MKYDNAICNQFVEELESAGYEVEHYHGRSFWTGPAARAADENELQDIIRATEVRLQFDTLGRGWIVYPRKSGELLTEEVSK